MKTGLIIGAINIVEALRNVPWAKIIIVIIPTIVALWEIRENKKRKGNFHRVWLPILTVIVAATSCWIVWSDNGEAKKSSTEATKAKEIAAQWQAKATAQLDRVEGKLGVEEASRRYVDGVRALSRQFTEVKTGTAVEKFFDSQSERQKLRDEVRLTNTKVLSAYQTKFQPVYNLALDKFDSWINEVGKRGVKITVATNEFPAVRIGNQKGRTVIRLATFPKGDTISFISYPASIEEGKLSGRLMVVVTMFSHDTTGNLWQMFADDEACEIPNYRPARFAYKPYRGNGSNPIEDTDLVNTISDSLDEVMAYITLEATSDN